MKKNKPNTEFVSVLAFLNVLALTYPTILLLKANSVDENLFATVVLIGALFVIAVVDAISFVISSAVSSSKP